MRRRLTKLIGVGAIAGTLAFAGLGFAAPGSASANAGSFEMLLF